MKKISIMLIMMSMIGGSAIAGEGGYQVGDKASGFKLKNVDGTWVSLDDYKDAKGFIVIFTCNHCPYAKAYEDRIIALDRKYAKAGYPVIAINPNDAVSYPEDSYENMQKRAKEKGFTFPYLFDEEQVVYPVYGATRTPHVYILSKTGTEMTVEYIGAIDDNYEDASKVSARYVEDAVDALMKGSKPEVTSTKAIGCSIKAKKS
jgi:peroxiredoxin